MRAQIDPEPPESERHAILAALAGPAEERSEWADAALVESVAADEAEP
jgi:hypothetical protein